MFIVYIVADQSLALFLGRSLKSATQVSRLASTWQHNIFLQWKLVEWRLESWVALNWVEIWVAFLQSVLGLYLPYDYNYIDLGNRNP